MEAGGFTKLAATMSMSASDGGAAVKSFIQGELGHAATAKMAAFHLKKQVALKAIALKSRTSNGVVTQYGLHRIKIVAKERPALARGFFAASKGKPFMPIGIHRKVLFT
jgi:hypothetical protein